MWLRETGLVIGPVTSWEVEGVVAAGPGYLPDCGWELELTWRAEEEKACRNSEWRAHN